MSRLTDLPWLTDAARTVLVLAEPGNVRLVAVIDELRARGHQAVAMVETGPASARVHDETLPPTVEAIEQAVCWADGVVIVTPADPACFLIAGFCWGLRRPVMFWRTDASHYVPPFGDVVSRD